MNQKRIESVLFLDNQCRGVSAWQVALWKQQLPASLNWGPQQEKAQLKHVRRYLIGSMRDNNSTWPHDLTHGPTLILLHS